MTERQKYESLTEEYQKLQDDLNAAVQTRQRLEGQFTENKSVQKEFATLNDTANVYKLSGPVLLKQDTAEAKSTVESRLQYIEGEIKRIEVNIKDIQEGSEGKKSEILRIQSQMQQQQQGATATAA